MKTTKKKPEPKQQQKPIPASTLLRAEASRLEVLKHAMPEKAQGLLDAEVWAFNLSAAFLDSLGAPEKLVRYVPLEAPQG